MRPSYLLTLSLALVPFAACGDDDGGSTCGEGTIEVDGTCVPEGTNPGDGPAARRLCNTLFGPVGADAIFVDANYEGDDSDGSKESPFTGIQQAVDAATSGQEIGLAAGTYVGDVTITKPVAVEGRCAAEVIVEGSIAVADTGNVGLRGLTVRRGSPGILATNVQPQDGAAFGLEIRFLVATDNDGAGVEVDGSSVRMRDSEFTLARQVPGGELRQLGSGVFVSRGSNFDIRTSVIEMNGFMGVDVADASGLPLTFRNGAPSTAAPTLPSSGVIEMNGIIGNGDTTLGDGGGIRIRESSTGTLTLPGLDSPTVTIIGNEFLNNFGLAIEVNAATVDILGNSLVGSTDSLTGVFLNSASGSIANNRIATFLKGGIELEASRGVSVSGNDIVDNTEVGILAHNCDNVQIDRNRIERTVSTSSVQSSGHGIVIYADDPTLAGKHNMTANTIVDNAGAGVAIAGLDQGVDDGKMFFSLIDSDISRNGFVGVDINDSPSGEMYGNVLNANSAFGMRCQQLAVANNDRVFFDGNEVTGTLALSALADDGDGVLAVGCHVSVDLNQLSDNARYGSYFTSGTSGGCTTNVYTNNVIDIVNASSGGMSIGPNTQTSTSTNGFPHDNTPVVIPEL